MDQLIPVRPIYIYIYTYPLSYLPMPYPPPTSLYDSTSPIIMPKVHI